MTFHVLPLGRKIVKKKKKKISHITHTHIHLSLLEEERDMGEPLTLFFKLETYYKQILQDAKEILLTGLEESWLVSPTDEIRHKKLLASHLTIGESNGYHFQRQRLKAAFNISDFTTFRDSHVVNAFNEAQNKTNILLLQHLLTCRGEIVRRLDRCIFKIRNEDELRYIVGDPLMEVLCDSFCLKVWTCILGCE